MTRLALAPEADELIDYILAKVENIPSLPAVLTQIMKMLNDPEAKLNDLQLLISQDVSLTTNTLKLANSAYYGFSGRIKTISQAIMILGFNTIRSLVFAASAYNVLKGEVSGYGHKSDDLWKHSVVNGLLSRELSQKFQLEDPEISFIAGLLHDVGKLLLASIVNEHFQTLSSLVEEEKLEFYQAERQILGFDHGIIGSRLLQKWGLPNVYVDVVYDHHEPDPDMEYYRETCCVHIANYLCYKLELNAPCDKHTKIGANVLKNIGMTPTDVQVMFKKGKDILDDWQNNFGVFK